MRAALAGVRPAGTRQVEVVMVLVSGSLNSPGKLVRTRRLPFLVIICQGQQFAKRTPSSRHLSPPVVSIASVISLSLSLPPLPAP